MSFSRALLNAKGPMRAVGTIYGGGTIDFYHNKDVSLEINPETIKVAPDGFSTPDERIVDLMPKLSFTPSGQWNANLIALLFPYLNWPQGQLIFDATDRPLLLHCQNAELWSIVAAAVTKMPNLHFGAKKTIVDPVEFTILPGDGTTPSTANAYFSYATTGGIFKSAGFTTQLIKTQHYQLNLAGISGFSSIETQDGFDVVWDVKFKAQYIDGLGTMTMWPTEIGGMIKFKPVSATAANIIAALQIQGSGAAFGRSYSATAAAATIVGDDAITYLTVPSATVKTAGFKFGAETLRNGEVGLLMTRGYNGDGTEKALATLAAS